MLRAERNSGIHSCISSALFLNQVRGFIGRGEEESPCGTKDSNVFLLFFLDHFLRLSFALSRICFSAFPPALSSTLIAFLTPFFHVVIPVFPRTL